MQFNKETTLHLYHYCTEIADALRKYLNTDDNFDKAEPEYWLPKLSQFKEVISIILDNPKTENQTSFLVDLFGENGSQQIIDLIDSIRKDQFYQNLLSRTLSTILIKASDMQISDRINTAIRITNEVIEKLEAQK